MTSKTRSLALGVSLLSLALAAPALAQTAPEADEGEIRRADEIVVQAQIGYRNRSESAEPTLVYDEQYFQRFEPLTAGDALKRVPSVTFLSDVIESDGARLRGLDPGYTQILIDGEKVPGTQADRSFFLDRIPAELIQQVEIVRSSSARRTGDAVAGTLNIVLRDGYALDGGYARGGALFFDDGEIKPSVGAVFGGELGPGRILLGGNFQGRYNPKEKSSLRYGDSPENNPDFATDDFDNREDQSDIRDGEDYAFNVSYKIEGETTNFELAGFYVQTDRTEDERSFEYNAPTGSPGPFADPDDYDDSTGLLTDNANVTEIDQYNYSLRGKLSHDWSLGTTTLRANYAKNRDEQDETEFEIDFSEGPPEFGGTLTRSRIDDREFSFGIEHAFDLSDDVKFAIGGFYQDKKRRTNIADVDDELEELDAFPTGYDQFSDNPTGFATGFDDPEPVDGGLNTIREERLDGYVLVEGKSGPFTFEAGLRYETTDTRINDLTVPAAIARQGRDYQFLLPSASVKWQLTPEDRIIASVARTNRRPRLDFLSPATLEEELGDNDLLGNPLLRPELAWGIDLGYERRLGRTGVAGINFFYRDVTDVVEIANTGDIREDDGDEFLIFQPRNTGNGKIYGVELDLSTDLGFIGLPETGVFGSFSYLDSEIRDFAGQRRFNDQSKFVFNVGFIQNLPSWGAAFGTTYRKQGKAFGRVLAEEVTTTYGADLEVFVEKRIGSSFTIRAVGSNLLDGKKRETFNKFDTLEDQLDRDFDEYELESERAGPVFQVIARYAF